MSEWKFPIGTPWQDPTARTLDDLWAAAEAACHFYSPYLHFVGVRIGLTGKGGWHAETWGWTQDKVSAGQFEGWGQTPRQAIGSLIVGIEHRVEMRPRLASEVFRARFPEIGNEMEVK